MKDYTMKPLPSPHAPTVEAPGAVSPEVRSRITACVLRWGIGLGTLVGAMTGGALGWLARGISQDDPLGVIGFGLMMGVVAGFVLGLFIAIADALFLVRFVPAVLSGKTSASRAAASAAGLGALAVFGLALFLLSLVWHGVLGEIVIVAPTLCLAVVAWIAGTQVGEFALKSVLHPTLQDYTAGDAPVQPFSPPNPTTSDDRNAVASDVGEPITESRLNWGSVLISLFGAVSGTYIGLPIVPNEATRVPSPRKSPTAYPSDGVPSEVQYDITGFLLRWGIGFGTLAGAVMGGYVGSRLFSGVPSGQFESLAGAVGAGAVAGLFGGLCVAIVEAKTLDRLAPAVVSGRTRAYWAASLGAAAGAVALGIALFLFPVIGLELSSIGLLVLVSWVVGTWAGTRALNSALNRTAQASSAEK